ncbi:MULTISPECIES: GCN5 family acetyltransferase [Exiguobacterium]|uniref:GCN5 family acetyltransferase n=1 Tax=Exiguobacterium TaxID=33986 RepID=UPI00087756D5|nr:MULTISPECIES: GCN5 family acetyltransferase [Exiguobacterium]OGX80370.1 GCN5 family acetyltransferase [Exiguobacterium sp. SH31]TCI39707.1 GCN5 family acetyltransferase [Exiguobacterium sp. SH4S7]TCI47599.1 GCN5 family acetyltransferase [Exiguobacterium sp. SH5S32]TCI54484.1 GCN5 family acetyltransferase [Exiguobacterium sp. SH1S4]TCI61334.1 GCN5 family acetyltransferase [Exiguobacterium sp. SH0S2]
MLVKYKQSHEKTAMGLLAFSCSDKSPLALLELVRSYEEDASKFLYLWKVEEDFVGIIGMEQLETTMCIHHIALSPSFRGEKRSYELLDETRNLLPLDLTLVGHGKTSDLLDKWNQVSI